MYATKNKFGSNNTPKCMQFSEQNYILNNFATRRHKIMIIL